MPANIKERCNAVEECYEFMLAYAAQGLPSDGGSQSGDKSASSWIAPSKRWRGWRQRAMRRW